MPIGIVSDEEFLAELGSVTKASELIVEIPSKPEVRDSSVGRGEGNNHVPESLKKIISETVIEEGRASARGLTTALGISDSSLSAYSNGATSTATYHKPNPSLNGHINKTKRRIAKLATGRLTTALESITDDKLSGEDAKDLSTIARNLAAVVRDMEPETDKSGLTQNNQFILMSPPVVNEDSFDTIVVNET